MGELELSNGLPPGPDFGDLAVLAETLGYSRVWIYDSPHCGRRTRSSISRENFGRWHRSLAMKGARADIGSTPIKACSGHA
jgi:alkanesulfonate monooxygenase SsuD/methylene tetrahydromethanopterin reductase-like flavin-dependent oxidoreductase (luciferase family)